ncbi:multicopper oxidase [Xylariaceae sp. FL1019]|nr:multicopper oxidase [Xylariaceae sp. FL1019]
MNWVSRSFSFLFLHLQLLQSCLASSASVHDASWQPEYILYASQEDLMIDCQQRPSVVFNGTSPGPPLYLKEGQTTWVRVYNHLPDLNVTTHWHGLTMRTAPFSDGTAQVSQWPIAPGEFFDYEIHPDIGDAGTYFYHSHVGFQAVTAHGVLYVEDADTPPYQYDGDLTMAIGDFYKKTDHEVESELVADPFIWPGEPDALVINDKTGTSSVDNATDDSCTPYVFTVQPGLTYRFRFIGATAISFVQVGIEEHTNLTVISADGYYTKPATTDHIQIGSGQRFDVLFTTKSEAELVAEGRDQYWIRFENRGRSTDLAGYAILQYERPSPPESTSKRELSMLRSSRPFGRFDHGLEPRAEHPLPHKSPVTLPPDGELTGWLEYTLENLNPRGEFPTLSEVTRTICITVEEKIVNGTVVSGTITGSMIWINNGLTWTETEAAEHHYPPYLIDAYVHGKTPNYAAAVKNGGWDPATKAFPAEVGEVLDIVWLSSSGPTGAFQYHPMHAHGEHYFDLGSGNGTYDAVANEVRFKNYTPARRDTTMLNRYASQADVDTTAGWRAWRIRITEDNVGAWMMHCHILQHMIMGMQTVWVYGDAVTILREIPEPYISGYLQYGGSAYGNDSYDPLVLKYFDE